MNKSSTTIRVVYRLSPDVYTQLVKTLPVPQVGPNTTELMAGQTIGIELVLRRLRDGIVTEETL